MVEPPLPFGNAAARWYYVLLKELVRRGHDVVAFAACDSEADRKAADLLFPAHAYSFRCYRHSTLGGIRSKLAAVRRPFSYMFSSELCSDLEAELSLPFDVLHLEMTWSGWLGLKHIDRAMLNVHYLFQIDRAEERPGSFAEKIRIFRGNQSENYLLRRYKYISAVSPRLTARIQEVNPAAEVNTVPLALDLSRYSYEPCGTVGRPVVTLIGSYRWQPSYIAGRRLLDRLWPRIRERIPDAVLQIVGRQALAAFSGYSACPGVQIFDNVPNALPYFRQARVLLYAPGEGSGMKVKVLEAFALGLAVVTTVHGVEGIPALDGVHAGICEDDGGLVERTITLLSDEQVRMRETLAARALVEQHCSGGPVVDTLEEVYRRIANLGGTR